MEPIRSVSASSKPLQVLEHMASIPSPSRPRAFALGFSVLGFLNQRVIPYLLSRHRRRIEQRPEFLVNIAQDHVVRDELLVDL